MVVTNRDNKIGHYYIIFSSKKNNNILCVSHLLCGDFCVVTFVTVVTVVIYMYRFLRTILLYSQIPLNTYVSPFVAFPIRLIMSIFVW